MSTSQIGPNYNDPIYQQMTVQNQLIQELLQEVRSLREEVQENQRQISHLTQHVEALKKELHASQDENQALRETIEQLQSQLAALHNKPKKKTFFQKALGI